MKKLLIIVLLAALVGGFVFVRNSTDKAAQGQKTTASSFNKNRYPRTDPASLWVIANKRNQLNPKDYRPSDLRTPDVLLRLNEAQEEMQLRSEAAAAVEKMFAAAERDGIALMVASAFRSYTYQDSLYNHYVRSQGQAAADTQSARPGYSEHQTGWAVDVSPSNRTCEIEQCFANTPEGIWIAANAYTYGFVIRYPEGKQETTGYIFEPWHLRYVGKNLSAEIRKRGNPTLEEYFDLPPAPDYQ